MASPTLLLPTSTRHLRRRRTKSCEGGRLNFKREAAAVQRSQSVGAGARCRIAAAPSSCSSLAAIPATPQTPSCSHPSYRHSRSTSSTSTTTVLTKTEEEEVQLQDMFSLLSQDEVEQAARTNYHYFIRKKKQKAKKESSTNSSHPELVDNGDDDDAEQEEEDQEENDLSSFVQRKSCATDMALRYLRSKKDVLVAVEKMKATLLFRRDWNVDRLRLAFGGGTRAGTSDEMNNYRNGDGFDDDDYDDVDWLKMQQALEKQLLQKAVYVQGYDKEGRATFVFEPDRVCSHEDAEYTIKMHIYTLERAVACSKAKDKTVNAVVHFGRDFSILTHAPPTHISQQFLTTLRSHYTGHVHQIFLIDAPIAFHWLWIIFQPFVGRQTKDKIHFIYGDEQKESEIGILYSKDQATSWMLPQGEKNRELDVDEYLASPFDVAFDEKPF